MKVFKIVVVAASLAAGAIPQTIVPALAQNEPSPETLQAARELVAVFNTQIIADTVTDLTAQVWPSIEQTLRAQNATIDAETLAELRKEYERLMTDNYAEVMKEAPAIYAKYFTAQEMRDLVAFYQTPLGAKTMQVMPKAMADFAAMTLARMQGLQEKVYLAFLNVLQKRGLYAQ